MDYASTHDPAFCIEDGRSKTFVFGDTNPEFSIFFIHIFFFVIALLS